MDSVSEVTEDLSRASVWLSDKAQLLISALLILVIGWYICNALCRLLNKAMQQSRLDESAISFISSAARYGLRILLIIIVVTKLGVDTTSIIALITSASLAVGLAMQGSLSNLAGGILLLIMHPFKVGDYINDGAGHEGTVTSIEIIYTRLKTADNQVICVPNGTLANSTITNVNKEDRRRIDFEVGIDYGQDIDEVRAVLLKIANGCGYTDQSVDAPMVFVSAFDKSSVTMVLRLWCQSIHYWDARFAIQEAIKKDFDARGISFPYEHLDVSITDLPDHPGRV